MDRGRDVTDEGDVGTVQSDIRRAGTGVNNENIAETGDSDISMRTAAHGADS